MADCLVGWFVRSLGMLVGSNLCPFTESCGILTFRCAVCCFYRDVQGTVKSQNL